MEFTQHLNQYEHARCVETFQWKCLICSIEAPDQVGLEMQHISDGFIRPQAGSQAGNFSIHSGEAKDNPPTRLNVAKTVGR